MSKLYRSSVWDVLRVVAVTLTVSCGQQPTPSLQLQSKGQGTKVGDNRPAQTEVLRSSSELDAETQAQTAPRQRLEVFQSKIEPLALQKGGSARIVLPITDDPIVAEQIQSISFSSESSALRSTSVQGRVLVVAVEADAIEGRHDARILVQLENGSFFSQPLAISVLP